MKDRLPIALSVSAFGVLCVAPFIMMLFEAERIEAVFGGLVVGSVIGSVLGIVALLLNKGKKKSVIVLSLIPICLLALFLLLLIPYFFYK